MARKEHMTWQPGTARFFKKFKGKMYTVSCRKLGCAPTKEAGMAAANAWWEAKEAGLAAAPPEPTPDDREANAVKVWAMVNEWQQLDDETRQVLVDSLVGAGQFDKLKAQTGRVVDAAVAATPPERTVLAQVDAWKALLHGVCRAGQMSEGRYDAYSRNVAKFADWLGPETAVDGIDEAKLEGFFNHLPGQVAAGAYAPTYAHTLLMSARQFVSRLAEMKLIPLPGNIRSRRMRFNHSAPTEIETFTPAEVRAMLAAAKEHAPRTMLFLLLMLNCGMYQNDVAELKQSEVDWQKGTLRRARSKTRERGGPVVNYKLWPETLALLREHRAKGDVVLVTEDGNPLVRYWLEDGEMRRYDCVQAAWTRLAAKMGLRKMRLGLKHLRKTSATLLGTHPQYNFFANHFLADSPKGMADRHYVKPNDAEFFDSLDWLRGEILGRPASPG